MLVSSMDENSHPTRKAKGSTPVSHIIHEHGISPWEVLLSDALFW